MCKVLFSLILFLSYRLVLKEARISAMYSVGRIMEGTYLSMANEQNGCHMFEVSNTLSRQNVVPTIVCSSIIYYNSLFSRFYSYVISKRPLHSPGLIPFVMRYPTRTIPDPGLHTSFYSKILAHVPHGLVNVPYGTAQACV